MLHMLAQKLHYVLYLTQSDACVSLCVTSHSLQQHAQSSEIIILQSRKH